MLGRVHGRAASTRVVELSRRVQPENMPWSPTLSVQLVRELLWLSPAMDTMA